MAEPVTEIRIIVPKKVADELEKVAARVGLTVNDLILRAIVKVIEEMGA